jgi:hypothetical protein
MSVLEMALFFALPCSCPPLLLLILCSIAREELKQSEDEDEDEAKWRGLCFPRSIALGRKQQGSNKLL